MPLMSALIFVLIVLVALDLTLTMAVIRKLRDHEERLAGGSFDPRPAVIPGRPLPEFFVSTIRGEDLSLSHLSGRYTVLAFTSTTCSSCQEALPALHEYLSQALASGAQAWAVVAGTPEAVAETAARLPDRTMVINEGVGGPLHVAVLLQAYPGYVVIAPNGTVDSVARSVAELPDLTSKGLVGSTGAP